MKLSRSLVITVVAALIVSSVWTVPAVGLFATVIFMMIAAPWGRSLMERALVSGLVVLGLVAIIFPRAGNMPLDAISARLLVSLIVLAVAAASWLPPVRATPGPRVGIADVGALAVLAVMVAWIVSAYRGLPVEKVVSGLYFSGWDNQGHFTTFANTMASGSTTWPTLDGSIAWNQWYPSLHTTLWSVLQFAISDAPVARLALVEPYVIWSGSAFAACIGTLTWIAGDLAGRWGSRGRRWSSLAWASTFGMAAVVLLGSIQTLFNAGFTNFVMAFTIVIAASYLSTRSERAARTLGWFVVPAAAVGVIGLWTPLVIGLVPAGVVVLVALWRFNRIAAITWISAAAAAGIFLAFTQLQAILNAVEPTSTGEFNEQIGAVSIGMAPFNVGLGIAAPFLVIPVVWILWHGMGSTLAWGVVGPVMGAGLLAAYFVTGADAAGVSRLRAYYVLKSLDAALLMLAPILVALVALGFIAALRPLRASQKVAATLIAGTLAVTAFGYPGFHPGRLNEGFPVAPGMYAALERSQGIEDSLVGEAIVNAAARAQLNPEFVPTLWDGSGQLVNLWVASLTNTPSITQTSFYAGMPPFPYDSQALDYVNLALNVNPSLSVNMLWFRDVSGVQISEWAQRQSPQRVLVTQVPMRPSPLCEECSG